VINRTINLYADAIHVMWTSRTSPARKLKYMCGAERRTTPTFEHREDQTPTGGHSSHFCVLGSNASTFRPAFGALRVAVSPPATTTRPPTCSRNSQRQRSKQIGPNETDPPTTRQQGRRRGVLMALVLSRVYDRVATTPTAGKTLSADGAGACRHVLVARSNTCSGHQPPRRGG
jgi:hypothetical protein